MTEILKSSTILSNPPALAKIQLAVQYVDTGQLKTTLRRTRKHRRQQIRKLANFIEKYGFLVPILVDGELSIISGHGRLEAAKLLGRESVPIIIIDHLTKEQLRIFALFENQIGDESEFDWKEVRIELQEIKIADPKIEITDSGFTIGKVDVLNNLHEVERYDDLDIAPLPPEKEAVVSQLGDLWILGRHVLVAGDATDIDVVAKALRGRLARIVLSDPPFNIRIPGVVSGKGRVRHRDFVMASGEMNGEEFTDFLQRFLRAAIAQLVDGAILYIFMDHRHIGELLAAAQQNELRYLNLLVWAKQNAGMGSFYRSGHELVAVFKHGKAPHTNNIELGRHGRNRSNVLNYPGVNSFGRGRARALELHPTVKPVALIADLILDSTAPGDVVLDPFGGSGTTLIAAEKTGRDAVLVELDPVYVDVIVRRFEAATGEAAIHAETGRTYAETALDRAAEPSDMRRAG